MSGIIASPWTVSGLLDISAATAGQIKFPATQNPSAEANTLDDYEEGTWVPTDGSGAGLGLTITNATYTKIGRVFIIRCHLTYPVTANGANAIIGGLPFTSATLTPASAQSNSATALASAQIQVGTQLYLFNTVGGLLTNANMSASYLIVSGTPHV